MTTKRVTKTFLIASLIHFFSDAIFLNYTIQLSKVGFVIIPLSLLAIYTIYKTVNSIAIKEDIRTKQTNFLVGISFGYIVCKIVSVPLLIVVWLLSFFVSASLSIMLSSVVIVVGVLFFVLLVSGMFNKYRYKLFKKELFFDDLPKSFDGFKIVQLSDMHSGSFDSKKGVKKGIDLVNKQEADVVLFTGDLVNNDPQEINPYIETFKTLRAKEGIFSVSGNHDYHYLSKGKETYDLLKKKHKALNFKMLNNESHTVVKNTESITISGVENWGVPPFPQFGNLDKALAKVSGFVVLMSHDPSHWDEEIKQYPKKIHLTLSGHTHGMQFGIDLPFFKWSPVKLKYPKWIDIYEEFGRYLYVNRGFGFIGYPGRVGIRPEVTLITLKKKR